MCLPREGSGKVVQRIMNLEWRKQCFAFVFTGLHVCDKLFIAGSNVPSSFNTESYNDYT